MSASRRNRRGFYTFLSLAAILVIAALFILPRLRGAIAPFISKVEFAREVVEPFAKKAPAEVTLPIMTYHYVEYVTDENDFIRESLAINPYTFETHLQ